MGGREIVELMKESNPSGELKKNDSVYFTEFRICCEISSNAAPKAAINPVCRIRALVFGSFPKLWYTITAYYFTYTSIKTFFEPVITPCDRPEEITNEEAKKGQGESQHAMNSVKNEVANQNPTDKSVRNEDANQNRTVKEVDRPEEITNEKG